MPNLRFAVPLLAAALAPAAATAQDVRYDVRFPNAAHHEAEITLVLAGVSPGPVELRMSRSSPGRYALHEFAKNVYDVRVTDGAGGALPATRPDPYGWTVTGHDGTVRVTYTLFGDRGDGTYAQIDRSHAHLNMPATFMWARGFETRPIRVTFHPPAGWGWKVASQLAPTDDSLTFTARDLQYFMDSPTELSDFTLRTWPVTSGGKTFTMRMAVHHLGTDAEVDAYVEAAKKIVAQEIAVFGEPAPYDHGTYTFIADYLPWASGDGMEHRNSTILSSSGSLARGAQFLIGTVAHEFFHSWNVERIRPRTLEPFDFERANMSGELWFAEGFTNTYTDLMLTRAGLWDLARYAGALAGPINAILTAPGRRWYGPVEMSQRAPFVDAATAVDPTNDVNTFLSYYTYGEALGIALDLTLRGKYDTSLDALMRTMWQRHGKIEKPYALGDIQRALGDVTHDPAFAGDFFAKYVLGHEAPDYGPLLLPAGLILRPQHPDRPTVGDLTLTYGADGATMTSPARAGSPIYDAGVDRGDVIVSLDGRALTSAADLAAVLAAHRPGDAVDIVFSSRGARRTGRLTFAADPRLEVVTFEAAGRPVTPAIQRFREAWLGAR